MVSVFQLANMLYHNDLCILKRPWIPGINLTWSWCLVFLMCCWIQFVSVLSGMLLLLLFSEQVMSNSLQPHGLQHARPACPSPTPGACSNSYHWVSDAIQPSHPLSSPFLPTFHLSQHQGLFQWVSSLQQVATVMELQLQHLSFQWIPRPDFL